MNKFEVIRQVIEVLGDIQRISGRNVVTLDEGTRPIGDLPGFDSLNGVEATLRIEQRLGIQFSETNNLFEQGNRALRVVEVAERVCSILKAEKE